LSAHETGTRALHGLVVVVDEDAPVGVSDAGDSLPARFEGAVRRAAGAARRQEDDSYALESGGAPVALLVWRCDDPPSDLLPPKQTLERLVCAAIGAAYPRRPDAVRSWLTARPAPPDDEPAHKAHAWSHMAGWYADHGCDDFYRAVWRDGRIAAELERRIALATGRRLLERLGNTGG